MIPDDAITGPKLIANAVTAGHINVANLQAISATIGILRTASSGQRQEIRDNAIKVFDAANVLRMQSGNLRSEAHTSELQSLMRISYAVLRLKKKNKHINTT